jgi:hypothetical protein
MDRRGIQKLLGFEMSISYGKEIIISSRKPKFTPEEKTE